MSAPRILLVEDEYIIAMAERELLHGQGYQVIATVDTGEEAIRAAHRERPDLVLMDISLKGEMNGIDAARAIRQQLDIPIIFVTAYTAKDLAERIEEVDSYRFVFKPISVELIRENIEQALGRWKGEEKSQG